MKKPYLIKHFEINFKCLYCQHKCYEVNFNGCDSYNTQCFQCVKCNEVFGIKQKNNYDWYGLEFSCNEIKGTLICDSKDNQTYLKAAILNPLVGCYLYSDGCKVEKNFRLNFKNKDKLYNKLKSVLVMS